MKSVEERLNILEDLVAQNKRAVTAFAEQATGEGARPGNYLCTKTLVTIP